MANINRFISRFIKTDDEGSSQLSRRLKSLIRDPYELQEEDKEFIEEIRKEVDRILSSKFTPSNLFPVKRRSSVQSMFNEFRSLLQDINKEYSKKKSEEVRSWKIFKEYENDFLIMAYGKVNSGKSTLANTIADYLKEIGLKVEYFREVEKDFVEVDIDEAINKELAIVRLFGSLKGEEDGKSLLPPLVVDELRRNNFRMSEFLANWFKEKKYNKVPVVTGENTEKVQIRRLDEDILESTAAIQGFRCGSLVWIDAPGLHSLTKRHEEIAKYYALHANLIIYTSTFDAPLRESDLKEIISLHKKEQPVLFVITKTDKVEERSELGRLKTEWIRPPQKEIEEREDYIREVLEKSEIEGLKGSGIISTSSKLWREGMRKESGLLQLINLICDTIEKGAPYMKLNTPLVRFKVLIKELLHEISERKGHLEDLKKRMERFLENMNKFTSQTVEIFEKRYMDEVNKLLSEKKKELQVTHSVVIRFPPEKYKDIALKCVNELGKNFLDKEISDIIKGFTPLAVDLVELEDKLERKFKKRILFRTYKEEVAVMGRAVGSIGGALVGGAIGSAIGGPVGGVVCAILGGIIGGWGGRKSGKEIGKEFKKKITLKVDAGDNLLQVRENLRKKGREAFTEWVIKNLSPHIKDSAKFFDKIHNVKRNCERVIKYLESMINKIESRIEKR